VYEKIYIFLKVFLDFPIIKKEQGFEHPNVAWLLSCGSEFLHVCSLHHTAHLERFPVPESINCFKLKKALYGLKQSPREWYNNMNAFLHLYILRDCMVNHAYTIERRIMIWDFMHNIIVC